ncbi:tail fiber domain-containing protein [Streptococcus mitis]|uniref:tail fiber domain-containing protein n=1 Tax=Streptococcus mitis TaxID=28037 RepID=UPI0039C2B13C
MDALTRRQFDRAMFAKDRTLAIRVGDYASRDIKEASFEYGYIKGDTYKPGGTCAGSGKITFTSIITTFNKLDILHPEIGLLVGNTYQWVKMGEYFINDIEIDRNRNTTTLELMDGMFKLNREYVTDLRFPAELREVIQEICLKTGIELANDYFGISAMRYHVEQVPEGKKLSFRDILSAMTQMIGMSCFFNREGKMEIRDLTESNITINADSYFLHGLTKSEIEYQIAGITCKTDKKSLTVGMKTGRSLELDNVFMTQSALNDLYYKLKNLTYYPYNLNYQGHLLLEVGQWVTIQTNKKETFKVPVLSQSFTFKGGLRGRISADSKSGNDTQYSYEGTITKQIKQQDGIEAKIQAQIEAADAAFDAEFKKRKKEIDDGIELAKAKAEEVKQELSDTINQRFDSFDNGPLKEAKRKAEEALKNAGASSSLAQEAKQIGLDSIAKLEAFKSQITTAQTALSGDLDALKQTVTSEVNQASEYRRTTTEALSRMTGQMNGFATKSEVKQDIDGLTQTFAKMKVGGRNYYRDSEKIRTSTRFFPFPLHPYLTQENVGETWTLSFDIKINEGGEIRPLHFYHYQTNRFGLKASADITPSKDWQRFTFTGPVIFPNDDPRYSRGEMALYDYGGNNNYSVRRIKLEKGTLATDWSPAPEDTDDLITEAKATFERTAQGLRTDLSAIQEYVNKDGQRQEALQRYTREESAKQATAVRELVAKDYVGKETYQEDVKGLERRFEAITNPQNGLIDTQIANYKTAVDGRFADITSLIAGKANQTDFQRVKETSQLYERILGNTENGIADKVARMAMTNQLFQVEVGKAFAEHQNLFLNSTLTKGFLGNNGIINVANATQKEVTSDFISVDPNEKIIFQHWVTLPENGMAWSAWQFFDKNKNPIDNRKSGLNAYKTTVGKQHNINQITVPANAYFVRFSARMYDDGLIKVEQGSAPSDYSVAPNDALEAVKTVQKQLAGSWAVQNINSAGDIISGINLGATGHNRITGKLTHITGDTLIDNAVIKSAMVDKLKTANFESSSVTTEILDAEAVTADKVRFDDAFIRKMIANEAFIDKLTSKQIFATKVESVVSSSTFLEAYQGRIGGFTIGHFDQGRGRWISGINQFSVGMGNGEGGSYNGENTAFWANWGYSWNSPGPNAWYVTTSGNMYCRNGADFHGKVDFSNRSTVNFYSQPSFSNGAVINGSLRVSGRITYSGGEWLYSPIYNKLWKDNSQGGEWLYLDRQGNSGRDWIQMNKEISDRRYKSNIQDSQVSGLDAINNLKTYSYRKEYDGKIEDIACGIMAQDVQKYAPEAFYENPDGAYSYRTFELVPYLIKAIQELNQKIEKMEKIIA